MSDKKSHPLVTKEVMQEYERLRGAGIVSMGDRLAVYTAARHMLLNNLAQLVSDDLKLPDRESVYIFEIMQRRDFYMKKYKLKR